MFLGHPVHTKKAWKETLKFMQKEKKNKILANGGLRGIVIFNNQDLS